MLAERGIAMEVIRALAGETRVDVNDDVGSC